MIDILKRKNRQILCIITIAICISTLLSGCKKDNNEIEKETDYKLAVQIVSSDETLEVRKYPEDDKLKIYKDGEYQSDTDKTYEVKDILKLPDVEAKQIDLTGIGLIADDTYDIEIEESTAYLKQLIADGYTTVYEAHTYKFVEYYLKDSDSNYLRVIITPNYMISYKTTDIQTININDYIFE